MSKPRWPRGRRRAEKKVGLETRAGKGVDGQGVGATPAREGRATSMRWEVIHASRAAGKRTGR